MITNRNYPPLLLTKQDVAYLLNEAERKVIDLANAGHLTRIDDKSKRTKFRLSDVEEYVAGLPEQAP